MAQAPKIAGDYIGVLGPLHIKLHLKAGGNGALEGTLDSVDQGAMGLACGNFRLEGNRLSFDVPSVGGKWHGTLSADGEKLEGTWSQGQDMPLVFRRDEPFVAAEKPSPVDGVWLGTLEAGGMKLRLQVHLKSDRAGKEHCLFDSLDQGASAIPCEKARLDGNRFSFELSVANGRWSGTLSDDGKVLNGTWSQGGADLPLRLNRQATAVPMAKPEPPKSEPAMAPVPVSELKAVLDRDLAAALKDGALAPSTNGGVVIGVVQHGVRRIFTYGPVQEDSIFEIGSVSKTFTSLLLAQMVERGQVKLDQPVRELLPPGVVAKTEGAEITLLDLATHQSGLPRMPDNFHPANGQDPYADYRPADLYGFIKKHGVKKPAGAKVAYSNLGAGLLGQALANREGTSYPNLLRAQVIEPLDLKDTVVQLSPEQQKRFVRGYSASHQPGPAWNFDALAGAGGIRSTASDMLTYLEAQLHPDRVPSKTLSSALKMCHDLRADSAPEMKIGLAWLYNSRTGAFWHNGATGAYSSYALFQPKEDYAVIVLFNTTIGGRGSFADVLGQHVADRLSGRQTITLQ